MTITSAANAVASMAPETITYGMVAALDALTTVRTRVSAFTIAAIAATNK